jgi:glutathione S-transferase
MESELGKTANGWFSGTSEPGAGDVSAANANRHTILTT